MTGTISNRIKNLNQHEIKLLLDYINYPNLRKNITVKITNDKILIAKINENK